MVEKTEIISYTNNHGNITVQLLLPTNPNELKPLSNLLTSKIIIRDQTNSMDWDFPSALCWKIPIEHITWSHISTLIAKDIATISTHARKRDVQSLRAFAWFIGHSLRRIAGRSTASVGPNIVIEDQVTMPIMTHIYDIQSLLRIETVMDAMINGAQATSPVLYKNVHFTIAEMWFCCLKTCKHARELTDDTHVDNPLTTLNKRLTNVYAYDNPNATINAKAQRKIALANITKLYDENENILHNVSYDQWWDMVTKLVTAATEAQINIVYPPKSKRKA